MVCCSAHEFQTCTQPTASNGSTFGTPVQCSADSTRRHDPHELCRPQWPPAVLSPKKWPQQGSVNLNQLLRQNAANLFEVLRTVAPQATTMHGAACASTNDPESQHHHHTGNTAMLLDTTYNIPTDSITGSATHHEVPIVHRDQRPGTASTPSSFRNRRFRWARCQLLGVAPFCTGPRFFFLFSSRVHLTTPYTLDGNQHDMNKQSAILLCNGKTQWSYNFQTPRWGHIELPTRAKSACSISSLVHLSHAFLIMMIAAIAKPTLMMIHTTDAGMMFVITLSDGTVKPNATQITMQRKQHTHLRHSTGPINALSKSAACEGQRDNNKSTERQSVNKREESVWHGRRLYDDWAGPHPTPATTYSMD